MKVARVVALAVVLCGAPATAAEPPALDSAVKAVRELRYPQARAELDALLKGGGNPRDRFVEILALHAEVVAVLDGPDAGERAFRRLLVIDPQHAPPSRKSPVVATPFERARKWVAANGALQVTAVPPAPPAPGAPLAVQVRLANDPLAMAAAVRVMVQRGSGFVAVAGRGLRASAPAESGGDYYLEVVDAADNVIASVGSAEEPLQQPVSETPVVAAPPAPVREAPPAKVMATTPAVEAQGGTFRSRHPLVVAGVGVGSVSLVLLGGAIGLDVTGLNEYHSLEGRCAPNCSAADLKTVNLERGLAGAAYALAAGGLVSALVMIIVDRVRAHH